MPIVVISHAFIAISFAPSIIRWLAHSFDSSINHHISLEDSLLISRYSSLWFRHCGFRHSSRFVRLASFSVEIFANARAHELNFQIFPRPICISIEEFFPFYGFRPAPIFRSAFERTSFVSDLNSYYKRLLQFASLYYKRLCFKIPFTTMSWRKFCSFLRFKIPFTAMYFNI